LERPPHRKPILKGSSIIAYSQREILLTGLKNAYALEAHAADVTQNQASRLGDYPELQRRVQQHHEETLRHRDRLGECLSQLGESPSTLKDSVLRLVGNMQTMFHATADDEVLKGTFASVSLEHYEIASYKSLIAMAGPATIGPWLRSAGRTCARRRPWPSSSTATSSR